jgi:hypothetical protein
MPDNLKIFLVTICVITFFIIYSMVKKKKILFKHAILWCLLDLLMVISIFGIKYLRVVSDFVGIEKISNLIFLFGFLVIIAICIGLTTLVAEQKHKIIVLTQELAILNNKVRSIEDGKDKKSNKE